MIVGFLRLPVAVVSDDELNIPRQKEKKVSLCKKAHVCTSHPRILESGYPESEAAASR